MEKTFQVPESILIGDMPYWLAQYIPNRFDRWEIAPNTYIAVRTHSERTLGEGAIVSLRPSFRQREPIPQGTRCKVCKSENLVRFGLDRKGQQRYQCKECGTTFVDNDAPLGMRFPVNAIASALNEFYESASLHKIRRSIKLNYGIQPDHSNVYRWIVKYTDVAVKRMASIPVKVGNVWIADETVLKLKSGKEAGKGENIWFWDIIDSDTRFLLASHLSEGRRTRDAETLMNRALERAGNHPKTIITDKLQAYLGGIEEVFGADSKHIQSGPFKIEDSTRDIERFHGTLKDRTKVLRALANRESAKIVLGGWLVHYNFFRPNSGIGNKTPAEMAGVDSGFKSWKEVVEAVG